MSQPGMSPSRENLQELAELRLREAEVLFAQGMYDGCAYLSGYAVELALKAVVCSTLKITHYPSNKQHKGAFAIHDFDSLLFLAGLSSEMTVAAAEEAVLTNWSIATEWRPERRYSPKGAYDENSAAALLDAIRNSDSGVLSWIKRYW